MADEVDGGLASGDARPDDEDPDRDPTADGDPMVARRGPRTFRATVLGAPSVAGLVVGAVCWHASTVPTLLPRSWLFQAVISALSLLVGYAVGVLGALVARGVLRTAHRDGPDVRTRAQARRMLAVAAVVVVALSMVQWQVWQDDQRDLVSMPHLSPLWVVPILALTAVIAGLLLGVGRSIGYLVARVDRGLTRHLPAAAAHAITVVVVAVAASVVATDLIQDPFLRWANDTFGAFDESSPEGVRQPTTATVSGGPGSVTPWDTLGYEGRSFAAGATPAADLARFADDGTPEAPVRVYAGLRTADTAEGRAALAVEELERTGGFDRAVLAVWTVTGTGWIDPLAARSLELMWAGDTAIVATQYSYFPSWISFLVDKDEAAQEGRALNDAVYERWSQLPPDDRPLLVSFGLSLGSYGSESAYAEGSVDASFEQVQRRSDGVLWIGPTHANPVWNEVEAARGGSPAWRPVVDDGEVMRFLARARPVDVDDWAAPRVVYIGHPSDPVTWWDVPTLWSKPAWQDDPVGYDVPSTTRWFPVVTWIQVVGDLIAGFSAHAGHGHNYENAYTDGWAAVAPPPGWTAADTERVEAALHAG